MPRGAVVLQHRALRAWWTTGPDLALYDTTDMFMCMGCGYFPELVSGENEQLGENQL